jgi:hypothetical protein
MRRLAIALAVVTGLTAPTLAADDQITQQMI